MSTGEEPSPPDVQNDIMTNLHGLVKRVDKEDEIIVFEAMREIWSLKQLCKQLLRGRVDKAM